LVATFHRSGSSVLYTVLGPLARRLAHRFAVRAAVSEAARTTAFDALGGSYEVGFNGVEVDRFEEVEPWPTDRPTVLFLGRHEERKGLGTLLDAFEDLRTDQGHGAATSGRPLLWIAGDGPLTESLRRLHPPSSDIRWLGVLSEEEKVRRLVAADVLCAPSLGGESFGMVLLEAMAARTVVVASDIDGYREASDGHAVLVTPADRRALAEALSGVLAGRLAVSGPSVEGPTGPRDRWTATAAERADLWSMERLARWYEGLYGSAMVRPPA
jgi:phosphatidylinositol alpha-mannosyltransferase